MEKTYKNNKKRKNSCLSESKSSKNHQNDLLKTHILIKSFSRSNDKPDLNEFYDGNTDSFIIQRDETTIQRKKKKNKVKEIKLEKEKESINPQYKLEKVKKGEKDQSYFSSHYKNYNYEETEKILIRVVDCNFLDGLRKLRPHKIENLSCLSFDFSRNSFDENDLERFFSHISQIKKLKKLKLGFSNIDKANIKFVISKIYGIEFASEEMEKYSLNIGHNNMLNLNCLKIGLPLAKKFTSLNLDFSLNTVKNLDKMLERNEIKKLTELTLNLYGCIFSSDSKKNEDHLINFLDALLKLNKLKKIRIDLRRNSENLDFYSLHMIDCLESLISVFREKFKNDKRLFQIIY